MTNLRGCNRAAGNSKLSKILKKGGLVVNQSVVLLMKCVQVQFFATQESGRNFFYFVAKNCVNSIASNPPFLKLRQALMRSYHRSGALLHCPKDFKRKILLLPPVIKIAFASRRQPVDDRRRF